jgi:hypothetical protein
VERLSSNDGKHNVFDILNQSFKAGKITNDEVQGLMNLFNESIAGVREQVKRETELRTLVSQELEISEVLRTSLYFLLRNMDPINAGVYLPDQEGQFTLAARANHSLPRNIASSFYEELGSVFTRKISSLDPGALFRISDYEDQRRFFGSLAEKLEGYDIICGLFPIAGNPPGVAIFFKDGIIRDLDQIAPMIKEFLDITGQQTSRVVKVQNRLSPFMTD